MQVGDRTLPLPRHECKTGKVVQNHGARGIVRLYKPQKLQHARGAGGQRAAGSGQILVFREDETKQRWIALIVIFVLIVSACEPTTTRRHEERHQRLADRPPMMRGDAMLDSARRNLSVSSPVLDETLSITSLGPRTLWRPRQGLNNAGERPERPGG
ncbi:hypothetical protein B0T24DRAFT_43354 [Lasiosphaeria ovina]|uniref:Uncharacterized protein n=1 Tax=Lasiosphaeria ovina TaxID=92902 RepID=A0AAE0TXN3_9PEZI|nr:hypothetical protein B0T24DRAFT_43354 [Lasiosphaeria ovina]